MVAFSCCEYDGGEEEKHEMDVARERSWRGKFRRKHRVIKPGANRVDGKCPLTPLEVHGYKFFPSFPGFLHYFAFLSLICVMLYYIFKSVSFGNYLFLVLWLDLFSFCF